MLTNENQIENINDIYILKECWNAPCGFESNQKIISNHWMIPITYIAEQCSMSVIQVLEEYLFSIGINTNCVGSANFIKDKANREGYDFKSVVLNDFKYANGLQVFADITKAN